ncbi:site-specific integrase [Chitinophaga silvisoli]|uniref:site-specific integrase n=1 Tax=Chitinophaga silvisoli TaxID=2291814 RepID=UPI0037441410
MFLFSCYTGLAFTDLLSLKPEDIFTNDDGMKWIRTSRAKAGTSVYVLLLKRVISILNIYNQDSEYIFPGTTNQNINRGLKIISEICEIKKHLTFHIARHTFATTITLMNQ